MQRLQTLLHAITPLDESAMQQARVRWAQIAKPLDSLGLLEELVVRMAGMTGNADLHITPRAVIVFCADNGVVAQGVTQTGQEVTAVVAKQLCAGNTTVCRMAQQVHCDVIPVDVGIACQLDTPGLWQYKVACGTQDFSEQPAMTQNQAIQAILAGADVVKRCVQNGYRLLATGEMGIGNTTTSSAILSVLFGCDPEQVTGRGAGLSTQGLARKIQVIRKAIALHAPDPHDPLDVLCKLGGFDIAAMTGAFLAAAAQKVPILVDGLISGTAALLAARLAPQATQYMLASHLSPEPACRRLLEALKLEPFLHCRMAVGEGTGAVAAIPILDMALAVYHGTTFADMQMQAYEKFT